MLTAVKNQLVQVLGALLAFVGALFVKAGTNDAGSSANDGLFLTIGIILWVAAVLEFTRQWRAGVFDGTPTVAIVASGIATAAFAFYIAFNDGWGPVSWIAAAVSLICVIVLFKVAPPTNKRTPESAAS